jgi:hypothetical protein
VTSQLHKLPQSIYYAWAKNDAEGGCAYSLRLNGDSDKNN